MDLLEHYLGAVAALLPKAQRQDIVAELRDLLLNRFEEKEAALGRPLDKKEREAVLVGFGHPLAVAGRYGPQRVLIGAELYPFYIFAVKAALAIAAIAAAVPLAILAVTGKTDLTRLLPQLVGDFVPTALMLIGAATLIGGAIERGWIKLGDRHPWRVADLPKLPLGRKSYLERRFEALFELIFMVLFILWWTRLVDAPFSVTGDIDGLTLAPAAVWASLYWPILVLAAFQATAGLVGVVKPSWVRLRAVFEIAGGLAGLVVAALLYQAGRLVVVSPDAAPDAARFQMTLDATFQIVLVVAVAVNVGTILVQAWRLFRGGRGRA
ncbi:hypothetical protein CSW58_04470 [Caulobacter sp. B11]|uniref:hypothetical protein n=1 Tax=Caulobacter sp. B11 TaxID=2048899 RepID=UPI000C12D3E2|nr:hypothetical protein [Caulobacter sp. B11]PHY13631.1 hypothetical protein CSW58_04470 [Caulobacter sp. B11]